MKKAGNVKIEGKEKPIRLFKSDFLEFFSHISPTVVLLIFVPITLGYLGFGVYRVWKAETMYYAVPVGIAVGWFIWTFVEYFMHRFIFHYHPKTERIKKFFFTFHGVHHAQPMCRTRLVMPPVISIPLAVIVFGSYYLGVEMLLNMPLLYAPLCCGTCAGYVAYDMVHYNLHHSKVKKGSYLDLCRRQHMRHHVTCPNMRFGVSIPLWDYVFGTMPKSGLKVHLKKSDSEKDSDSQKRPPNIPVTVRRVNTWR